MYICPLMSIETQQIVVGTRWTHYRLWLLHFATRSEAGCGCGTKPSASSEFLYGA